MLKQTLALRAFGLAKIPLILFVNPTVEEFNDDRVVIRIPLNRITRNHLKSMYFGTLAIGADTAGGLMAWDLIRKSGKKINLVFSEFHAKFLLRPTSDVFFVCADGPKIRALVDKAAAAPDRVYETLKIMANIKGEKGEYIPVADFDLTISLKQSSKK